MADTLTNLEQIEELAMEHLATASLAIRTATVEKVVDTFFSIGTSTGGLEHLWVTRRNITRIILEDGEFLKNNVVVAMYKERLGLGPKYYYVEVSGRTRDHNRLFCLTKFLPQEKFIIVGHQVPCLKGLFDMQPKGKAMAIDVLSRRIPVEELPSRCRVCHDRWCTFNFE